MNLLWSQCSGKSDLSAGRDYSARIIVCFLCSKGRLYMLTLSTVTLIEIRSSLHANFEISMGTVQFNNMSSPLNGMSYLYR